MKLDQGEVIFYEVYHAELMRFLQNVQWVNADTNQYGVSDGRGTFVTLRAKKIEIYLQAALVIINPISDPGMTPIEEICQAGHKPQTRMKRRIP